MYLYLFWDDEVGQTVDRCVLYQTLEGSGGDDAGDMVEYNMEMHRYITFPLECCGCVPHPPVEDLP